jgi:hypothetical protein
MHQRSGYDGRAHADERLSPPLRPARHEKKSERMREIRLRIAADAYRAADVAGEVARRILLSREL